MSNQDHAIATAVIVVCLVWIAVSAVKYRRKDDQPEDQQTLRQYLGLSPETTLDDLIEGVDLAMWETEGDWPAVYDSEDFDFPGGAS